MVWNLFYHYIGESDILNDAHLQDELETDDACAADSDSGDSGGESVDKEDDPASQVDFNNGYHQIMPFIFSL